MIKRLLVSALVLLLLTGAAFIAAGYWLFWWAKQPLQYGEPLTLEIARGETLTATIRKLHDLQLIPIPEAALLYSKLTHKTAIQYGEYRIETGMSWHEINDLLMSGKVIERQLTLVEGWSAASVLAAIQSNPKVKTTLVDINDPRLVAMLPPEHPHPEGWFFADTYSFHSGDTDLSILTRAHNKMRSALDTLWQQRTPGLPYENAYQALIMASIVEKETGLDSERAMIAGVFIRRLQKKMRLQTDPTVIYGLGANYQGNITRQHLKQPSDYNTYVIAGLPPTPIALVGQAALEAAFHPDDGNALYFVAKGDGSHHFSATLAEHNKAVRQYQINNRRQDYRSSPSN